MNSKEIFDYIKALEKENKDFREAIALISMNNKKRFSTNTSALIVIQDFETILKPGELPNIKSKLINQLSKKEELKNEE